MMYGWDVPTFSTLSLIKQLLFTIQLLLIAFTRIFFLRTNFIFSFWSNEDINLMSGSMMDVVSRVLVGILGVFLEKKKYLFPRKYFYFIYYLLFVVYKLMWLCRFAINDNVVDNQCSHPTCTKGLLEFYQVPFLFFLSVRYWPTLFR